MFNQRLTVSGMHGRGNLSPDIRTQRKILRVVHIWSVNQFSCCWVHAVWLMVSYRYYKTFPSPPKNISLKVWQWAMRCIITGIPWQPTRRSYRSSGEGWHKPTVKLLRESLPALTKNEYDSAIEQIRPYHIEHGLVRLSCVQICLITDRSYRWMSGIMTDSAVTFSSIGIYKRSRKKKRRHLKSRSEARGRKCTSISTYGYECALIIMQDTQQPGESRLSRGD